MVRVQIGCACRDGGNRSRVDDGWTAYGADGQGLADQARPDHRAVLSRQRHRPASANGVRARRGQRRSDHHHRKPAGRGRGIGVSAVAKADSDGHTILVHSNALVTAPAIQHMPYDPVQDFAGVTTLGNVPLVLVISPDKNIKTVKELVAAAKAKPGSINYAAAG